MFDKDGLDGRESVGPGSPMTQGPLPLTSPTHTPAGLHSLGFHRPFIGLLSVQGSVDYDWSFKSRKRKEHVTRKVRKKLVSTQPPTLRSGS